MKINTSDQIDKFFEEFQHEIDAHFKKVFEMISELKMYPHQNQKKLSKQIMNQD